MIVKYHFVCYIFPFQVFYIVKHIEKGVFVDMRKFVWLFALLMLFSATAGYASEFWDRGIQTYYVGTRDAKAQLTISTSGKANCTGTAKPEASTSKVFGQCLLVSCEDYIDVRASFEDKGTPSLVLRSGCRGCLPV